MPSPATLADKQSERNGVYEQVLAQVQNSFTFAKKCQVMLQFVQKHKSNLESEDSPPLMGIRLNIDIRLVFIVLTDFKGDRGKQNMLKIKFSVIVANHANCIFKLALFQIWEWDL